MQKFFKRLNKKYTVKNSNFIKLSIKIKELLDQLWGAIII